MSWSECCGCAMAFYAIEDLMCAKQLNVTTVPSIFDFILSCLSFAKMEMFSNGDVVLSSNEIL